MRFPLVFAIIIIFVNALVDVYIYCALVSYFRNRLWARIQKYSAILCTLVVIALCVLPKRTGADSSLVFVMWLLFAYMTVYLPKYVFLIFDVLSRIPMLWRAHRWRWMSWAGFYLGILLFALMWWGAFNRLTLQVKEVEVEIPGLPTSFAGMKIVQLSDIHSGTYGDNTAFLEKLVDRVNSLHPDLILFTGDIVNRRSDELKPFLKTLSGLKAVYGVYSIMGNHDYGDYYSWPNPGDGEADALNLKKMEGSMGWHMLNNDHAWIHRGNDSIALIGVENIGDPPFRVYGDLSKSYPDLKDNNVKILLSHNPAHWDKDIAGSDANIALTLSGHTHAMQIELFGLSPAALRYKHWGGMYSDGNDHKMYVNIGEGTVGFPARIGATPEITLFTLKPSHSD